MAVLLLTCCAIELQPGTGWDVGEAMEQLWGPLKPLFQKARYMTLSRRQVYNC